MSLNLHKRNKYANPYYTTWDYLQEMTELLMKALNGMTWTAEHKEIHINPWYVPVAFNKEKHVKESEALYISYPSLFLPMGSFEE